MLDELLALEQVAEDPESFRKLISIGIVSRVQTTGLMFPVDLTGSSTCYLGLKKWPTQEEHEDRKCYLTMLS